jgi:hypothetical protein
MRRNGLVACLLAAAVLGAGCGDDTNSKVDKAVDQCLEQAKSINDKDARKTAEDACKAAKSRDTGKVRSDAKKQCLDAVKSLPEGSAKDQAKQRCEQIK